MGVGGLYAMTALTEAAVAWRGGDARAARELAMAACREWSAAGRRWAPDMARALALACGAEAQPEEVTTLMREALAFRPHLDGLRARVVTGAGGSYSVRVLVRAVRSDRMLAHIPVLVVSTDGSPARRAMLSSLGVAGYLAKPFRPEDLRRAPPAPGCRRTRPASPPATARTRR